MFTIRFFNSGVYFAQADQKKLPINRPQGFVHAPIKALNEHEAYGLTMAVAQPYIRTISAYMRLIVYVAQGPFKKWTIFSTFT